MRVCGIIAEYDPFHKGHAYHLARAREISGADYVVCVQSTAFTQRGTPSFFSTADRAKMAVQGGADAVFSLPVAFSVMEADRFARGGVGVLKGLGTVTHLAFGCEDASSFSLLEACADALESPDEALEGLYLEALSQGESPARARASALEKTLSLPPGLLKKPNNVLALCYLRQLRRQHAPFTPVPVQRLGQRDDQETDGFLSSSVLRRMIQDGEAEKAFAHLPCPDAAREALREGRFCMPDALDQAALYALLTAESLCAYSSLQDGLPDRVTKYLPAAASLDALVGFCSSRRYTRSGIRRFAAQALLRLPREGLLDLPGYTRLLAFREEARPLLAAVKKNASIPVVAKAADHAELLTDDIRAEDIRNLGCKCRTPLLRQSPYHFRRNQP